MSGEKDDDLDLENLADRIMQQKRENLADQGESEIDIDEILARNWHWFGLMMENQERWYSSGRPNPKIADDLVREVSRLLIKNAQLTDNKNNLVAALRFYYLSKRVFGKTYTEYVDKNKAGQKIGTFAVGLCLYGAPLNATFRFLNKLLGEKEKTIEKYYRAAEAKDIWIDNLAEKLEDAKRDFVKSHLEELTDILLDYDCVTVTSGPNKTDKDAYNAFRHMEQVILEVLESDRSNVTVLFDAPFTIAPDTQEAEKRDDRIKELLKHYNNVDH